MLLKGDDVESGRAGLMDRSEMPNVQERLAYLEGRVGDHTTAINDVRTEIRELRAEIRKGKSERR